MTSMTEAWPLTMASNFGKVFARTPSPDPDGLSSSLLMSVSMENDAALCSLHGLEEIHVQLQYLATSNGLHI